LVASGKPVVDGAGRLAVPVCPLQTATEYSGHGAFTLVELLVVVAVIALLSALAFTGLRATLETSRRATCAGNLKTLATGVLGYAGENNGFLPYSLLNDRIPGAPASAPWFWAAGDYMGSKYTGAQEIDWGKQKTLRGLPSSFYCPSAKRETSNTTPYDISYGINRILVDKDQPSTQMRVISVPRPSRMVLLADSMSYSEKNGHAWKVANGTVSKRHGTVANVAWLDGHVSREPLAELATNASYWDPSKN
jgi:prepilin-type N-terminal cleavage/methylation domain-containing protein/prepilin-type processing-associated H-X9-DG protein